MKSHKLHRFQRGYLGAAVRQVLLGANVRPCFDLPLLTTLLPVLAAGSGTPTFTRSTTSTVTDFEGLLRTTLSGEARFQGARRVYNRTVGTESFLPFTSGSSANQWCGYGAGTTVTAGQTDPNGGTGAGKVSFISVDGTLGFRVNGITSGFYRYTVWARVISGTHTVRLACSDTSTWSTASVSGTITLTTTWQRISLLIDTTAMTLGAGALDASIGAEGKTPFSMSSTGDIYIAFPIIEKVTGQANQNPSEYVSVGVLAAPYQGANVDGVQYFATTNGNTVASNVVTEAAGTPISAATLLGYVSEGARTNLCLRSQDGSATWNAARGTLATDTGAAPDGSATVQKFTATSSSSSGNGWTQGPLTIANNAVCTFSIYLKQKTVPYLLVQVESAAGANFARQWVNMATGALGTAVNSGLSGVSATTTTLANGWYRIAITATLTGTSLTCTVYLADADNSLVVTNADDVSWWGAQAEQAPFASSYIPTTTASVTRNADVLSYAGAGNVVAAVGTVAIDVSRTATDSNNYGSFSCNDGVGSNRVDNRISGQLAAIISSGGVSQLSTTFGGINVNAVNKTAIRWSAAGASEAINGVVTALSGGLTPPASMTLIQVGGLDGGTGNQPFGTLKNLRIWRGALPDANLAVLTAP